MIICIKEYGSLIDLKDTAVGNILVTENVVHKIGIGFRAWVQICEFLLCLM